MNLLRAFIAVEIPRGQIRLFILFLALVRILLLGLASNALRRPEAPRPLLARVCHAPIDAYNEDPIPRKAPPRDWLRKYALEYAEQLDRAIAAAELQRILQGEPDDAEDGAVFEPGLPPTPGKRPGRNDPCWCGSGKKYKNCHLSEDAGLSRN